MIPSSATDKIIDGINQKAKDSQVIIDGDKSKTVAFQYILESTMFPPIEMTANNNKIATANTKSHETTNRDMEISDL